MIVKPINIADNLICGNETTIPEDAQLTICCSRKIFKDMLSKPTSSVIKRDTVLYYNREQPDLFWINDNRVFVDVYNEEDEEIDTDLVMRILKILYEQLPFKKIYLYNCADETDALAIGFVYLTIKRKIDYTQPDEALNAFCAIVPGFSPTPEWVDFIYEYYGFDAFLLN